MDRLDSWLNRQVGWQRAAVLWVMLCALAIGLGDYSWPGTAFFEVAAVSVLAAIPVAGLAAAAQLSRQARNPGKPYLSWRMCVAMWCTVAAVLLGSLIAQPSGRHSSGSVWFVQLALFAAAFLFWLLAVRRWSKARREGWSGRSPVSASPRGPYDH